MIENLLSQDWYAAFVVTGEEDKVKERLSYRYSDKVKVLVPKRRLKERKNGIWSFTTRVLFPGYVLLKGNIDDITCCDFRTVPKVIKPLRNGHDMVKIDNNEMQILSKLICNNEVINFSSAFVDNGRVKVIDGPLLSLEGNIVSIDQRKGRAKVSLDFLGDKRIVELGITTLSPAALQ